MGIVINGGNNGIAVEGNVTIGELNLEFGKGVNAIKREAPQDIEYAVVVAEESRPTWEEAIPEYLRTGKWETAWKKLKEEGFLDADYHSTKQLKEPRNAHYVASCFVKRDGSNEYACFERLWGMKNLRQVKSNPDKDLKDRVDKIFSNLL